MVMESRKVVKDVKVVPPIQVVVVTLVVNVSTILYVECYSEMNVDDMLNVKSVQGGEREGCQQQLFRQYLIV